MFSWCEITDIISAIISFSWWADWFCLKRPAATYCHSRPFAHTIPHFITMKGVSVAGYTGFTGVTPLIGHKFLCHFISIISYDAHWASRGLKAISVKLPICCVFARLKRNFIQQLRVIWRRWVDYCRRAGSCATHKIVSESRSIAIRLKLAFIDNAPHYLL